MHTIDQMEVSAQKVLRTILDSPWAAKYTPKILSYYQQSGRIPKRYALYSSSLDRFILVDGLDLWGLEHAAKLLSSKMTLVMCIFSNEEPLFSTEDCLTWSLVDKTIVLPKKQMPELHIISGNSEVIQEGVPNDFSDQLKEIVKDQEFALFVLRASYAMRLTNLFLNSHESLNNTDQNFYTDFYSREITEYGIQAPVDKTNWAQGFLGTMSTIIYRAQTIEEVLETLSVLYKEENFDYEVPLYRQFFKQHEHSFLFKQAYLKIFFEFFGWKPESC